MTNQKPASDEGAVDALAVDALAAAQELIQADEKRRIDLVGKGLAELLKDNHCEIVAVPGQATPLPSGETITAAPTIGIKALRLPPPSAEQSRKA